MTPIRKVAGIGPALAGFLAAKSILTAEELAKASPETLQSIPRLGAQRALGLIAAAQKIVSGPETDQIAAAPVADGSPAVSPVLEDAPAPQGKTGKNATAKPAKPKDSAKKDAAKAKKSASKKAVKKSSEKAAKAESDKKTKAKEKKADNGAKVKTKKAAKVKDAKPKKTKKKAQSKKK